MGTIPTLPWSKALYNYYPFKIDALGLVTLLGAEEINATVGRLVPSRYLEYLPLLGAYVISGERFKDKLPSFNLYNITDGINTSDLSSWLTRWMLQQEFEITRSIVQFDVVDTPRSWAKWHVVSAALSILFTGFLLVMTILIGDWYGLANAVAMVVSVFCRAYSMQAHRNAIDRAVLKATKDTEKMGRPTDSMKTCVVIMSDSKAVTLLLPGHLIIPVFSHNPEPAHSATYHLIRYIGWVFIGIHIVTIGMAQLIPQLYTIVLLVIPTILICWKLGCDDSKWGIKFDKRVRGIHQYDHQYKCWIGTRLKATVMEWPVEFEFEERDVPDYSDTGVKKRWVRHEAGTEMPGSQRSKRRQDLYAWLKLTEEEESSLSKWDLLPHDRSGNQDWWKTYQIKKALITERPQILARRRTESKSIIRKSEVELGNVTGGSINSSPGEMTGFAQSPFVPPASSNTVLTSNGFIAPSNSVAHAVFSGMGAAGLALNPNQSQTPQSRFRRN